MAYLAQIRLKVLSICKIKHVHVIEKRSLYSQNVFCSFFLLVWCVPYRGEVSVILVGRGNLESCSEPKKTTQSCAGKYEGVFALYRMKFDYV